MVTLIEGDGIGPEIAQSVKDIFTAAKVRYILSAGWAVLNYLRHR